MERCDVLIVGGGPAGSSCAWALRKRGFDVRVLDKAIFPRDKVCAGWITPTVIEALKIDMEEYGDSRTLQPITGFRTGMVHGTNIRIDYGHPVSYGIRRCEFDHYLLNRCGVQVHQAEPVRSVRRTGKEWIVNDKIRTPLLIGAGGHFCPIARFLGARIGGHEPAVAASEIEFPLETAEKRDCPIEGEVPQLYFCQDLKGYGWCFRKGDFLNIGIGREDTHRLSRHLEDFCGFLQQRQTLPAIRRKFNGHAYLLYQHSNRKWFDDGVLLIGDAAGLAYPESGEGIRPAVESALMAAHIVGELNSDYRANRLAVYGEHIRRRFGGGPGAKLDLLPQRARCAIASRLLVNHWFARHVVLNRWFLHANQTALA